MISVKKISFCVRCISIFRRHKHLSQQIKYKAGYCEGIKNVFNDLDDGYEDGRQAKLDASVKFAGYFKKIRSLSKYFYKRLKKYIKSNGWVLPSTITIILGVFFYASGHREIGSGLINAGTLGMITGALTIYFSFRSTRKETRRDRYVKYKLEKEIYRDLKKLTTDVDSIKRMPPKPQGNGIGIPDSLSVNDIRLNKLYKDLGGRQNKDEDSEDE